MKKAIAITTLIATTIFSAGQATAESSKEESIGFASGAVAGAAIGGPLGFIIGGAVGAVFGDQVEKANDLDEVQNELAQSNIREQQLKEEIVVIQKNLKFESNSDTEEKWVANGLTLNLMFTTNSSSLSDADRSNIAQIAEILTRYSDIKVRLDGYSDPRGSKTANMVLAQQRVDSVITEFESLGINSERLLGLAHGEIEGVYGEQDMDAYAMARKVSVNFVTPPNSSLAQN